MKIYDHIIIGAGPAGIQLGYFLQQQKLSYAILEKSDDCGSFFKKFPRHRKLLSINKPHTGYKNDDLNLRWDWNSLLSFKKQKTMTEYTKDYFPDADVLVKYLNEYARENNLNILYNVEVEAEGITKNDQFFTIKTASGEIYQCKVLIVATGLSKSSVPNDILGIELAESYDEFNITPEKYKNKRVLILGKGNSAFEVAESLIPYASHIVLTSPHYVSMSWHTHYVGNLRAVNNNAIDAFRLKSQVAVLDDKIKRIVKKGDKYFVTIIYGTSDGQTIAFDHVILCTGFEMDASIFGENVDPKLHETNKYPLLTHEWESVNVKNLYFAGTLMHSRDYKKTATAFIHGFRYNVQHLSKVISKKYHAQPFSYNEMKKDHQELSLVFFRRINRSSALWHQFGFIADLVVVEKDKLFYYEELPVDYVHMSGLVDGKTYFTLTFNYTTLNKNLPLSEEGKIVNLGQNEHAFLHPVIRKFASGQLIDELHVGEDILGEWISCILIKPVTKFLESAL